MTTVSLDEKQFKILLKQTLIELFDERRDLFSAIAAEALKVEASDQLLQAAVWYTEKNADFIDAFNAAWMLLHGISSAATFDQKYFNRFDHIQIVTP